ncbi:hypothetical protein EDD11_008211 [Mortierella claussenii]|nr:hypothetical protein EDD11_008211 [Mortierella claussenii]
MSNVLSPIVARYSVFFTLAMFQSSVISQSRQPTHLVQSLLIEAQQRYQNKVAQKMRALIRHVSTTSSSTSSSFVTQPLTGVLSFSVTTDHSSSTSFHNQPDKRIKTEYSAGAVEEVQAQASASIPTIATAPTAATQSPSWPVELSKVPSLPPAEQRAGSSVGTLDERLESANATLVPSPPPVLSPNALTTAPPATTATAVVSSDSLDLELEQRHAQLQPQHQQQKHNQAQQRHQQQAQASSTVTTILHEDVAAVRALQSSKVSKTSIATLLSVTLVMILLSLLQNKKQHLRRKAHSSRSGNSQRHRHQHRSIRPSQMTPRRGTSSGEVDDYKSNSLDQSAIHSHSQSPRTNTLTLMDGTAEMGASSPSSLSQSYKHAYHRASMYVNALSNISHSHHHHHHHPHQHAARYARSSNNSTDHIHEPTQQPLFMPVRTISTDHSSSYSSPIPQRSSMYANFAPNIHHSRVPNIVYNGNNIPYSLSEGHLPGSGRSEDDLVTAWLGQQNTDMSRDPSTVPSVDGGQSTKTGDSPEAAIRQHQPFGGSTDSVHQLEKQEGEPWHYLSQSAVYYQMQLQQQAYQKRLSPQQLLYSPHENQSTIINSGAQREPRQEEGEQEQQHRASLLLNHPEYHQGSIPFHLPPYPLPIRPSPAAIAAEAGVDEGIAGAPRHHYHLHPSQYQQQPVAYWQNQQYHYQIQPPQHRPVTHPANTAHQHAPFSVPGPDLDARNIPLYHGHAINPPHGYAHYPLQPQRHHHHQRYETSSSSDSHSHVGQGHRRSLSLTHTDSASQRPHSFHPGQQYQPQYHQQQPKTSRFEDLSPAEQVRQEHQLRRQRYQMHHQYIQHQQHYRQQYHSHHQPSYLHHPQHRGAIPLLPPHAYLHQAPSLLPPPSHHYYLPLQHHPQYSLSRHHSSAKDRSAHELAWERHCYYQQQQHHEDLLAERKRREKQWRLQNQRRDAPQAQQQETGSKGGGGMLSPAGQDDDPAVIRTSSLNRIASASLSPKAAQALGLSRSKSVAVRGTKESDQNGDNKTKSMALAKELAGKSSVTDCHVLTVGRRLMKKTHDSKGSLSMKQQHFVMPLSSSEQEVAKLDPTTDNAEDVQTEDLATLQPVVPASVSLEPSFPAAEITTAPIVTRRKTLKNSIKSLAHRYSSRFSNSRPNSFAGMSSDPIINFAAPGMSEATKPGSLNTAASRVPVSIASETEAEYEIVDLKQVLRDLQLSKGEGLNDNNDDNVKYFPPTSISTPHLPITITTTTPLPAATATAAVSTTPTTVTITPLLPGTDATPERIPIHRKVTLFRSKTLSRCYQDASISSQSLTSNSTITTLSNSTTGSLAAKDDESSTLLSRTRSLLARSNRPPQPRQRDSLRLANGRGIEHIFHDPKACSDPTTTTATTTLTMSETAATTDGAETVADSIPADAMSSHSSSPSVFTEEKDAQVQVQRKKQEQEQHEVTRRQILALLSMGRKERLSAKTGRTTGPTLSTSPSTLPLPAPYLSPLALEAQEDYPAKQQQYQQAKEDEEEDSCAKIAFMLVPKSRYEFQPLVVV